MSAGLILNGVTVFESNAAETWSSSMFNQRVLKKFGDEIIKDLVIEDVRQSRETTNELLSAAIQRDTPETGYEKFHLGGLDTLVEEGIIERIKQKLSFVKDFKVAGIYSGPNEVRTQFLDFAADVLEQHESQMTAIDFSEIIFNREVTDSDQRLVEALTTSEETALKVLNLFMNE